MPSDERRAYMREYAKRPEVRARERARKQTPEALAYDAQRHREARADPVIGEKRRAEDRLRRSGFSADLVARLRVAQKNGCGICACALKRGRAADGETTDHFEPDGVKTPRGLLCQICNKALGFYERHQRVRITIAAYEDYLRAPPVTLLR